MTAIRPIRPEDIPAIIRLVEEAGFPARSEAGWHWVLFGNPEQGDMPAGLVAERNGQLVAMIGLQARGFLVNGEATSAICGHTFISGAEGRGAGFALARRALKIHGSTAIYSLNNNAIAGTFHKRIGLKAWLGTSGRARMEWPVRPLTMIAGQILTRLARYEPVYEWLSSRELFTRSSGQQPLHSNAGGGLIRLHPGDTRHARLIDDFGKRVSTTSPAAPVRSARIYDWQMSDPDAPGRIVLIGVQGHDGLDGLVQLVLTKPNSFEPPELEVTDMAILPGTDPAILVPRLIREARDVARKANLSRLRLPFSDRFNKACYKQTGLRLQRHYSYDPAHAAFRNEADMLATRWMPTGFEGDMFFALRIPPDQQVHLASVD